MRTESPQIENFIDGEFVQPVGGKYLDNIEPATGKPYSQVADSDARDVEGAVAAAEKAFVDWSKKSAAERSKFLLSIADLIERDLENLAREVSYCYALDWHFCSGSETSVQMDCPVHAKLTAPAQIGAVKLLTAELNRAARGAQQRDAASAGLIC